MNARLYECFLRIAERGSINKAAADLNMSQPALSRHLALLEHDIGARLFVRTQGGVHLTEAGKLLADRIRPLLRQLAILREQVGQRAAGQLSVGIPPSWHTVFTVDYAFTLLQESPNVALRVYEGVSHMLRDHLFAGLLDLCIVPADDTAAAGYIQTPLVREPLVLVGSADAALDPAVPVPISRLDAMKLILPGRPNVLAGQIENALLKKGLTFELAVETDTLQLCLELARRAAGFTVVPACALHSHPSDTGLRWAPIRGMGLTWALLENEARSHSAAVRAGRRMVMTTLDHALEPGTWFGAQRMMPNSERS